MKLISLKIFVMIQIFVLAFIVNTYAAEPNLLFSDLTSGPSTGLNDGHGMGAIVTIWGTGLGSSQGTSKIYFKDSSNRLKEAAYIYYWKNADGALPGGPSDLYTYHKMQEIAFSIPESDLGKGEIYAIIGTQASNPLQFTVNSGNIFYVTNTGNNNNSGSYDSPWATINQYSSPSGAASKAALGPGDIIYVKNVTEAESVAIRSKAGTVTDHIGLVTYPGAYYKANAGLRDYYPYESYNWTVSKISVVSNSNGISTSTGWRVVGCAVTDNDCADGQGGAITAYTGKAGDNVILGNYIYDFGGPCTTSLHHVFYLSNRSARQIGAYELGWNYVRDCSARHALHIYDESACGDFSGTFKIHGNVVVNQKGSAFNANASGTNCITAPIEVYNNLFINCGLDPWQNYVINVSMSGLTSHIKFYNNTIYGFSQDDTTGGAIYIQANGSDSWNFGGSFEWTKNIVVDTYGRNFVDPSYTATPTLSEKNGMYSTVGIKNLPNWSGINTSDPQFENVAGNNFLLKATSSLAGSGANIQINDQATGSKQLIIISDINIQ